MSNECWTRCRARVCWLLLLADVQSSCNFYLLFKQQKIQTERDSEIGCVRESEGEGTIYELIEMVNVVVLSIRLLCWGMNFRGSGWMSRPSGRHLPSATHELINDEIEWTGEHLYESVMRTFHIFSRAVRCKGEHWQTTEWTQYMRTESHRQTVELKVKCSDEWTLSKRNVLKANDVMTFIRLTRIPNANAIERNDSRI